MRLKWAWDVQNWFSENNFSKSQNICEKDTTTTVGHGKYHLFFFAFFAKKICHWELSFVFPCLFVHHLFIHSLLFLGFPWFSLVFLAFPLFSLAFLGFPWISLVFVGFPCFSLVFLGFPWFSFVFLVTRARVIGRYDLSFHTRRRAKRGGG